MTLFRVVVAASALVVGLGAQEIESPGLLVSTPNDHEIGTVRYRLAKLSSTGNLTATLEGEATGIVGVVQKNAGKSGNAAVAVSGKALCEFDGPAAAGDYVQPSTSTVGTCHDAGQTRPSSGIIIGRVLGSTELISDSSEPVYEIFAFPPEIVGVAPTKIVDIPTGGSVNSTLAIRSSQASAASPDNSILYQSLNGMAGVINSSSEKLFLNQSNSGVPTFGPIAASDLPTLSSTNLADSSTLIRSNQVPLAGTPTPEVYAPTGTPLNAYGDSITAGKGASVAENSYVRLVSATKGWSLNNYALGGDGLFDQIQNHIWGSTVGASSLSLMMLGTNDGQASHDLDAWRSAYQAAVLWLTTQVKTFGNALSVTGTWTADSVLPTGIRSTQSGATATGNVFGSAVYVVARSPLTNSPTFTITVDRVAYGPYTTPVPWTTQHGSNFAPYAVRIGNLSVGHHTVVVTNIGTGELHIDFITGNKSQLTATGPFLYAATIYKVMSQWEFVSEAIDNSVRGVVQTLAADGLGVVLSDVEGDCANPNLVDGEKPAGSNCSQSDGVHPNDAGHRIIANSFLRTIASSTNSGTSSSGSFPSSPSFTAVSAASGTINTLNASTLNTGTVQSSGWLTVQSGGWLSLKAAGSNYWQISGSGHFVPNVNGGSSIGTDGSGALGVYNSPNSIRATNVVAGGYKTQTIAGSPNLLLNANTIAWTLSGDTKPTFQVDAGKGARFLLIFCQDSIGGHLLTWPANVRNGMTVPSAPGACSVQEFVQTLLGSNDLIAIGPSSNFVP